MVSSGVAIPIALLAFLAVVALLGMESGYFSSQTASLRRLEETVNVDEDPAFLAQLHNSGTEEITEEEFTERASVHRPRIKEHNHEMGSQGGCLGDVTYNGGPLMTNGANLYTIWISNSNADYSSGSSTVSLMTTFLSSLGSSSYYKTVTSYTDSTGAHVSNRLSYKSTLNLVTNVKTLNDTYVKSMIQYAINYKGVPKDSNGIYLVFFKGSIPYTSVLAGGSTFGPGWCGFHSAFNYYKGTVKTVLKYAVVGDPSFTPAGQLLGNLNYCSQYLTGSVNGNAGADGMASTTAHEIFETVTDPQFNGWYDSGKCEAADKCAWTFGTTNKYNTNFGGKNWLLQQMWTYKSGSSSCTMTCPLTGC